MTDKIGKRVVVWLSQDIIDEIDARNSSPTRSEFLRTLIAGALEYKAPRQARQQAPKAAPEPAPEPEAWRSVRDRALVHQYAIQPKGEADDVIAKILSAGGGHEENAWTIFLEDGMKTYRPILEAWEAAQKETPPG